MENSNFLSQEEINNCKKIKVEKYKKIKELENIINQHTNEILKIDEILRTRCNHDKIIDYYHNEKIVNCKICGLEL
jgi:hypothetical protein